METNAEKFPALQCTKEGKCRIEKAVAREFLLTIFLNGQETGNSDVLPERPEIFSCRFSCL